MDKIKSQKIQIKMTKAEFSHMRVLADIYAGGNLSRWLRHAGVNAPRKFLVKKKK